MLFRFYCLFCLICRFCKVASLMGDSLFWQPATLSFFVLLVALLCLCCFVANKVLSPIISKNFRARPPWPLPRPAKRASTVPLLQSIRGLLTPLFSTTGEHTDSKVEWFYCKYSDETESASMHHSIGHVRSAGRSDNSYEAKLNNKVRNYL